MRIAVRAVAGALGSGLLALALAAVGAVSPAPALAAAQGFVRVNQLGYAAGAPKRAYLMTSAAESGATFAVRRTSDGTIVSSASLGAPVGSWSAAFPDVYALDFDGVSASGTYEVQVSGSIPATSPPFTLDSPANLYGQPLANALAFYENERDGPHFVHSALRTAPGHLNDASAETYLTPKARSGGSFRGDLTPLGARIDASGGWWDAGDYLKFVQTTSYAVSLLLTGVRDFPSQMGSSAGGRDFTAEARFGLEWLLRMWDDSTQTLYYQVGIGTGNRSTAGDHDIWRLPQSDDTYGGGDPLYRYIRNRPAFRAGPPGAPVSPNLAGRDAAAFALGYQVFRVSDPSFAASCLLAAEHIFDLANVHPKHHLLTALPFSFYPERQWRDDLELGATELADALSAAPPPSGLPHASPGYYLSAAANWAHAYITKARGSAETLNLYDVSGLAHYELYRAIVAAGTPAGLAVTPAQLLAALGAELQGAVAQAAHDPFDFGFPWNTSDTASHGAGLAVMAKEYDQLSASSAYAAWGARWLADILGANAWGSSFIIGDGSTFPRCPQHQVANLVGSLDGTAPVLAGAVVEGPNEAPSSGLVEGMRA
ncbi:MAG TPA: glycoside hydrolase family 9 protein, partial [Solirubrobacteraceae bacterium]|nr:glycoside hydrolase family 9 protein [Solirubrobacteraceae bacterium]